MAYRTYFPGAYGELERLAGISDRVAFWRQFATEAEARAEIHARIEQRIATGAFSPCWPRAEEAAEKRRKRRAA